MKKLIALLLITVLLLSFAGCGNTAKPAPAPSGSEPAGNALPAQLQTIVDRGVLRVGTKVDVPHFGYQNADTNEVEGAEVDIARAIAKRLLGDENAIETQGVTAQTRGPLLDNGEVDIIIATFTITEERKQSFNFTVPYFVDEIGFLVKKSLGATDIKSLDGKLIGVAQSATTKAALEEKASELGISFKFSEFASYPELNTALGSGRIDAFSVDKSILLGYVNETSEILEEGFKPQEYGIACKLDNKDLAAYLDEAIEEMKADGTLDTIFEKWGLK